MLAVVQKSGILRGRVRTSVSPIAESTKVSRSQTFRPDDRALRRTTLAGLREGLIRAEVVSYADYVRHKGETGCRTAGVFRVEGKEYVVHDGDVMHFRFNV